MRKESEKELVQETDRGNPAAAYTADRLLHELQVHQVELEMQNETLRQALASRDEYHERLIDLYDFAPVGYLTLNDHNLITEANLTAAFMLGLERNNMIQQSFYKSIANESQDDWLKHFHHLKHHGGKQSCELLMLRSNGSTFPAQIDGYVLTSNTVTASVRLALIDITERKQIEQIMKDADRRKDEFLAMLAHELRNPLAPISNAVEVMKLPNSNPSRISRGVEIIEHQIKHLSRLIDDLLDISRIKCGLITLKQESLGIRDFIQPAVETSQPLLDARNQQLTLTLPEELLWVKGDKIRLAQVVSNLINNASKFSEKGGSIRLTIEPVDNMICIRVADDGCGIDSADLIHLFDLFYQAERNLDRIQGGLGIGLSLVDRLVKQHGGSVRALSAGLEQGSEFVVRLPRLFAIEPTAADFREQPKVLPQKKRNILVVEDNSDVAESLTLLLEIYGHHVLIASDGPEALKIVEYIQPDVILLDIGLPGMNGYEVAKTLRCREELADSQIIALTGYGQPEDMEKSRTAGIDAHLVKPIDIELLLKLMSATDIADQ